MSQAQVLKEFWPKDAEWFVIGGPADGDEAQWVRSEYPSVKCVGFEPNVRFAEMQNKQLCFPGEVYQYALTNYTALADLRVPMGATDHSGSICRPEEAPDVTSNDSACLYQVMCRKLDHLSVSFGPFNNAVLWLDIEYAELPALRGASRLLEERRIKLINLETYAHLYLPDICNLLYAHGFKLKKVWNIGTVAGRDAQDYVFKLEE